MISSKKVGAILLAQLQKRIVNKARAAFDFASSYIRVPDCSLKWMAAYVSFVPCIYIFSFGLLSQLSEVPSSEVFTMFSDPDGASKNRIILKACISTSAFISAFLLPAYVYVIDQCKPPFNLYQKYIYHSRDYFVKNVLNLLKNGAHEKNAIKIDVTVAADADTHPTLNQHYYDWLFEMQQQIFFSLMGCLYWYNKIMKDYQYPRVRLAMFLINTIYLSVCICMTALISLFCLINKYRTSKYGLVMGIGLYVSAKTFGSVVGVIASESIDNTMEGGLFPKVPPYLYTMLIPAAAADICMRILNVQDSLEALYNKETIPNSTAGRANFFRPLSKVISQFQLGFLFCMTFMLKASYSSPNIVFAITQLIKPPLPPTSGILNDIIEALPYAKISVPLIALVIVQNVAKRIKYRYILTTVLILRVVCHIYTSFVLGYGATNNMAPFAALSPGHCVAAWVLHEITFQIIFILSMIMWIYYSPKRFSCFGVSLFLFYDVFASLLPDVYSFFGAQWVNEAVLTRIFFFNEVLMIFAATIPIAFIASQYKTRISNLSRLLNFNMHTANMEQPTYIHFIDNLDGTSDETQSTTSSSITETTGLLSDGTQSIYTGQTIKRLLDDLEGSTDAETECGEPWVIVEETKAKEITPIRPKHMKSKSKTKERMDRYRAMVNATAML